MANSIDPRVLALAEKIIAENRNKLAVAVLKALLDRGSISTDELQELGYNHPPRAVADVRDAGIPIISESGISARSGRRMAIYSFGNPTQIQDGRIGGRSAFPKSFKTELIKRYGSIDFITGAKLDDRILQIDHRVPYRIAGDTGLSDHDAEAYMLLDGSSQRAKSWSCEHCPNMLVERNEAVCKTCFWAFPNDYLHIATKEIRRTDIVWQDADVTVYDKIAVRASLNKTTVAETLRELARHSIIDD